MENIDSIEITLKNKKSSVYTNLNYKEFNLQD
jgi:hypothetical protein